MKTGKRVAIVTGASAGLGAAFATAIDAAGEWELDEIWLVARRLEPMQALAQRLRRVKGVAIAVDLEDPKAIASLAERMERESVDLRLLVNNAGFGKAGPFDDLGLAEQLRMIDLNVRALTDLSWRAIPRLARGGAIVQVASSIAYLPAPNFAVYAASKAYVLSFSEALEYELRPKGVRVIAVCPGPVQTEFFDVAGRSEAHPGRVVEQPSAMSSVMATPEAVAQRALRDLRRGKSVSVYGASMKAFAALAPFVPRELAKRAIAARRD